MSSSESVVPNALVSPAGFAARAEIRNACLATGHPWAKPSPTNPCRYMRACKHVRARLRLHAP
eukprot:14234280-Alexandrium_andersonii.AAC.1